MRAVEQENITWHLINEILTRALHQKGVKRLKIYRGAAEAINMAQLNLEAHQIFKHPTNAIISLMERNNIKNGGEFLPTAMMEKVKTKIETRHCIYLYNAAGGSK